MTTETRMFEVIESERKNDYALIVLKKIDSDTTKIVLAVDLPEPALGSIVTVKFELAPPRQHTPPTCAWCEATINQPKDRVRIGYETMHADCRDKFQAEQKRVQRIEQLIECPF